jgi:imidazole glycerol-phosphate synthase
VFACQFNPEKSGKAGFRVLRSWLEASVHAIDAEYVSFPKRTITIPEMDAFTKRIIACMVIRVKDDGDLAVTKGDQFDACGTEDPGALKIAMNTTASVNGTHGRGCSPARKAYNLGKPVALAMRYF